MLLGAVQGMMKAFSCCVSQFVGSFLKALLDLTGCPTESIDFDECPAQQ